MAFSPNFYPAFTYHIQIFARKEDLMLPALEEWWNACPTRQSPAY
jgi:hypothetical protein